jgi:hypothetical protein
MVGLPLELILKEVLGKDSPDIWIFTNLPRDIAYWIPICINFVPADAVSVPFYTQKCKLRI